MPYFYTDATGTKQGPINDHQLRALVARGAITPQTPLETDTGQKGLAGQIPGLFAAAPSPFQTTPPIPNAAQPQGTSTYAQAGPSLARFDFDFRDIRLPKNIRLVCGRIYLGYMVFGVLCGIFGAYITGVTTQSPVAFFAFLLVFLFTFPYPLLLVRLFCEWQIVLLDWMTEMQEKVRRDK